MTQAGAFVVRDDHPSLPGHFPGHPVVPGVVLLDLALGLISALHPTATMAGLAAVKFIRPVEPGQAVGVACAPGRNGQLAFLLDVDGAVVARGSAMLSG